MSALDAAASFANELIRINVGGTLFITRAQTLVCAGKKSLLWGLTRPPSDVPDPAFWNANEKQWIIDRDPFYFGAILSWLRYVDNGGDPRSPGPLLLSFPNPGQCLPFLLEEINFYGINYLSDVITQLEPQFRAKEESDERRISRVDSQIERLTAATDKAVSVSDSGLTQILPGAGVVTSPSSVMRSVPREGGTHRTFTAVVMPRRNSSTNLLAVPCRLCARCGRLYDLELTCSKHDLPPCDGTFPPSQHIWLN